MKADVVIIGAGAAGLMCAIEAGKRGRKVIVLEHTTKIAEKIRISGGGRCNFTNLHCKAENFISNNPDFCRSALKRYGPNDFIDMVERHKISYHEKTLGQLFCNVSAADIINMLLNECRIYNVDIRTSVKIGSITKTECFTVSASDENYIANSVVIASGGLSIPKIGASPFGYVIAEQFGLKIIPPRAGLVPLVFDPVVLHHTKELSGVSIDPAIVKSKTGKSFFEGMLFTHRGLSGPAVLQISSYWHQGEDIIVNLAPDKKIYDWLKKQKTSNARSTPLTVLSEILPKRLAALIIDELQLKGNLADQPDKKLKILAERVQAWTVKPSGSEGYRTAEVTLGGVDTDEISSKTFESVKVPGLYLIGEVLDVTGHLGGFNFQWAWSSGYCAGQHA